MFLWQKVSSLIYDFTLYVLLVVVVNVTLTKCVECRGVSVDDMEAYVKHQNPIKESQGLSIRSEGSVSDFYGGKVIVIQAWMHFLIICPCLKLI